MSGYPIDFVIPWVDGSDPAWRASKAKYLAEVSGNSRETVGNVPKKENIDAADDRYRDWDILPYWFRAVEKYAPWVHTIHFVTCGQTPEWMNTQAKGLHLVNHTDFIPPKYLPTFSSHPIELNLHRIPGLQEHFVYFNDDFYLTAPVKRSDFFRNGLPCDMIEEKPPMYPRDELYNYILVNDIVFANAHFERKKFLKEHKDKWFSMEAPKAALRNLYFSRLNKNYFFGFDIHHLPMAYRKETFEKVWEMDFARLDATCRHRFRDFRDVSQCVFKYTQLLSGEFAPYDKNRYGKLFKLGDSLDATCRAIENQEYKMICINDTGVTDFDASKAALIAAFEKVFPDKSRFEK